MRQYIVDAFTDRVFAGNPAAVCVLDKWLDEAVMMSIAAENNLSETAFLVKEGGKYRLRWFTPTEEVGLCGHATLASAFVLLNYYGQSERADFTTRGGELSVVRKGELYGMDLPTYELKPVPVTDDMEKAIGVRPISAVLGLDLICVLPDESDITAAVPDHDRIKRLDGRMLHITARGGEFDCVSRSFGAKIGIAEDPVCGSAHCQIADYWAGVLGKSEIKAYQASKRGGTLYCTLSENGRIKISGKAVLFSTAEINWQLTMYSCLRRPKGSRPAVQIQFKIAAKRYNNCQLYTISCQL